MINFANNQRNEIHILGILLIGYIYGSIKCNSVEIQTSCQIALEQLATRAFIKEKSTH